MGNNSVVFAYALDGLGGGSTVSINKLSKTIRQKEQIIWVHVDGNHRDAQKWLQRNTSIDEIYVSELLSDDVRPRVECADNEMLLFLKGSLLKKNNTPGDMTSIRMWINEKLIITTRKRKYQVVEDIRDMLKLGKGPKSAGDFVAQLTLYMASRLDPILSMLNDVIDSVEEELIENENSDVRETIARTRKNAIILYRHVSPQRTVIQQIMNSQANWINELDRRYLAEVDNDLARHIEDLGAVRERAQIVKDELMSITSERLNRNMYTMSVMTAIFLPLGFLTGLLGINVGGMPGVESSDAFWITVAIIMLIVTIQIVIFKKFKWL